MKKLWCVICATLLLVFSAGAGEISTENQGLSLEAESLEDFTGFTAVSVLDEYKAEGQDEDRLVKDRLEEEGLAKQKVSINSPAFALFRRVLEKASQKDFSLSPREVNRQVLKAFGIPDTSSLTIMIAPEYILGIKSDGSLSFLPESVTQMGLKVIDLNYEKPVFVYQLYQREDGSFYSVRITAQANAQEKSLILQRLNPRAPYMICQELYSGLSITVTSAAGKEEYTYVAEPADAQTYQRIGRDKTAIAIEKGAKYIYDSTLAPIEIEEKVKEQFQLPETRFSIAAYPHSLIALNGKAQEVKMRDGPMRVTLDIALDYDKPIAVFQLIEDAQGFRCVEVGCEVVAPAGVKYSLNHELQVDLADVNAPFVILQDLSEQD